MKKKAPIRHDGVAKQGQKATVKKAVVKPKRKATAKIKKYRMRTKRPGRTLTLSKTLLKSIKTHLTRGCYESDVYRELGIPHATWGLWKSRARDLDKSGQIIFPSEQERAEAKLLLAFLDITRVGRSAAINRNIAGIARAGTRGDWRASAWFLERWDPKRFGKRDKLDLEAKVKAEVTQISLITEADQLAAERRARRSKAKKKR